MKTGLFAAAALALCVSIADAQDVSRREHGPSAFAPPVDLWLDQISFDRGARMRPHFTTEPGAFVLIARITSDGELRVMYPARPDDQKPYRLGEHYRDAIPASFNPGLNLYESSGRGIVFAIASYRPFDFRSFAQGRQWNTARLAAFDRYGDPFEVMRRFVDEVLPASAQYSLDYEVYEVFMRDSRVAGGNYYYDRYIYTSLTDYHDACLSAFGYRYSYYCRSYRGGYYGPIVIGSTRPRPNPGRRPETDEPKSKITRIRPLTPDPIVPSAPEPPQATGRQPSDEAARAARERYERLRRNDREPVVYRSYPPTDPASGQRTGTSAMVPRTEPRSVPRSEPRVQQPPAGVQREPSAPRVPRVESRPASSESPPPRSKDKPDS